MIPSGTLKASSACLRCQFRQVLLSLRRPNTAVSQLAAHCRPFVQTACKTDEQQSLRRTNDGHNTKNRTYKYRHPHIDGKVVGRPGRRQRTQAEKLATESLGQEARVIVFRDYVEDPKTTQLSVDPHTELDEEEKEATLSAEQIETLVKSQNQTPEQKDVNVSIDTLRPQNIMLDESEYDGLLQQLLAGYNAPQLARYLISATSSLAGATGKVRSPKDSERELSTTLWQAGTTNLEQRLESKIVGPGTSKTKLAEQVLRQAWNVRIAAEEQQYGELELRLKLWQMKMLFNLTHESRPVYERFIGSKFLSSKSEIQAHRPDNVMRITARRQDAEEIASLIKTKLSHLKRLKMDLKVFRPLLSSHKSFSRSESLLDDETIKFVQNQTGSILEIQPRDVLIIHSMQEEQTFAARRLLLAHLDLPSPVTTKSAVPTELLTEGTNRSFKLFGGLMKDVASVKQSTTSLHRLYQDRELCRLVVPTSKFDNGLDSKAPVKAASRLGRRLDALVMPTLPVLEDKEAQNDSPWVVSRNGAPSPWMASLCALVHSSQNARDSSTKINGARFMQLHGVPGLAHVISYLKPIAPVASSLAGGDSSNIQALGSTEPTLLAHLIPSPFGPGGVDALKKLPRLVLQFQTNKFTQHGTFPRSMEFSLNEQQMQVSLPEQATDLVFSRSVTMSMPPSIVAADWSKAFGERLQKSLATSQGVEHALTELEVPLPPWLQRPSEQSAGKSKRSEPEAGSTMYLLDRFEHVQETDFVPLRLDELPDEVDTEVRDLVAPWPEQLVLRVREVDAGALGGTRTEIRLVNRTPNPDPASHIKQVAEFGSHRSLAGLTEEQAELRAKGPSFTLASTAMSMLKLLTMASNGRLKPLIGSPTRPYD